jgi:hypothetical protein
MPFQEIWVYLKYEPNMEALWDFANQGSGFIYHLDKSDDKDGDYSVQCLAQETRDLIYEIMAKKIKLSYHIKKKLYSFIEKDKRIEIPRKNQINGKEFAKAIIELASIMNCDAVWKSLPQRSRYGFLRKLTNAATDVCRKDKAHKIYLKLVTSKI